MANFVRDVVEARPARDTALVVRSGPDGGRRTITFGELGERSARLAGLLRAHGVDRGDVVLTVIGHRVEWVETMLACFRIGAVALPCTEQLRAADLRLRLQAARPKLVLVDERDRSVLEQAGADCPVLCVPDPALYSAEAVPAVELAATDPCLMVFTSGTSGEPKAVLHGQRYLWGQRLQAEHWMGVRPGDLVWCTAAPGWSKSARNAFVAPWLRGAAALLYDARFDPNERLAVVEEEKVSLLCMAPTEYRVIARRGRLTPLAGLHGLLAAGEALDAQTLATWREVTGIEVQDGYGQSETGQVTANPPGVPVRPGSMGRPLPGVRAWIDDGELVVDSATVPTFFLGYAAGGTPPAVWRTGDRVRQEPDGYLYFEGRTDDVIVSAGYRIGPFEIESVLGRHPAVAEAAVVAAPDVERGEVVRAVVVLRPGVSGSPELVRDLQEHVKAQTAPYKYPRIVEFVAELPKTSSGKIQRAQLRTG